MTEIDLAYLQVFEFFLAVGFTTVAIYEWISVINDKRQQRRKRKIQRNIRRTKALIKQIEIEELAKRSK